MNSKGSFTAVSGVMVIVLLVTVSYFILERTEATDNFEFIREAGTVKRGHDNFRIVLDRAIDFSISKAIEGQWSEEGSCGSKVCSYQAGRALTEFTNNFNAYTLQIEEETGVTCRLIGSPSAEDFVFGAAALNLNVVCERILQSPSQGQFLESSTKTNYSFQKTISASANVNASGLRECGYSVVDAQDQITRISKGFGGCSTAPAP